ncbi:MAG: hypothetical protein PHG08_01015 [Bacilli bacterium]|nr:hypothetical protein [Bacilli bacterium]
MKTIYSVERQEITNFNQVKRTDTINNDAFSLDHVNSKIKDYAEAWRDESRFIQHNPGQSIIYFADYRVEYTRIPKTT